MPEPETTLTPDPISPDVFHGIVDEMLEATKSAKTAEDVKAGVERALNQVKELSSRVA